MKYISADKLKAEIERRIENGKDGYGGNLLSLLTFITSLQQEQSEPSNNLVDVDAVREDFITEVYRVLDADSTNDRANAIIDAFDSLPTVSREQPEVDLDNHTIMEEIRKCGCNPNEFDIARHFYNLALEDVRREVENMKAPIEYNKMEEESFYSSLSTVIDLIDDLTK